ncbi:terminase large subunit, partial [Klebsiella pneumoniae]
NVLVKTNGDGNKSYKKKEEVRRKTDGFKAFEYCLWRADEIIDYDYDDAFDMLDEIEF